MITMKALIAPGVLEGVLVQGGKDGTSLQILCSTDRRNSKHK